jgi:hypothetical protein
VLLTWFGCLPFAIFFNLFREENLPSLSSGMSLQTAAQNNVQYAQWGFVTA